MIIIFKDITPLLLAIVAIIVVIYLSYLFSKYVALGASKFNSAKHMKIVDRLALGQDKLLVIVQIGQDYFLASVTSQSIQFIKKLKEDDLVEIRQNPMNQFQAKSAFKNILQKYMSKIKK
ncbi:FliO/MopB family protein [Anaerovorax odorimutans]|uniref:FliO/MopB family protein n=1 Tax=Anaerovorax odorimutans TaxID=109327 RepID=UPI0006890358|nr:flagellar biosynthetic protein FliO [Anaerovorax odorimutans]